MGTGRVHLRDSTRARDDSVMRSMVLPTFGPRQIASVTPGDVQGWIASLTAVGYAPSTIRKACELAVANRFEGNAFLDNE